MSRTLTLGCMLIMTMVAVPHLAADPFLAGPAGFSGMPGTRSGPEDAFESSQHSFMADWVEGEDDQDGDPDRDHASPAPPGVPSCGGDLPDREDHRDQPDRPDFPAQPPAGVRPVAPPRDHVGDHAWGARSDAPAAAGPRRGAVGSVTPPDPRAIRYDRIRQFWKRAFPGAVRAYERSRRRVASPGPAARIR